MIVTLIDNNKSYDYVLPKKVSGKHIINIGDNNKKSIPLIVIHHQFQYLMKIQKRMSIQN